MEVGGPGDIEEGYTYSKIGAFVENFEFNWRRWRQPPGTLGQIDPCQLWAVEVSAAALENAGFDGSSNDFDRSKCGVSFANALGERTEICPTSEFGRTTQKMLQSSTAYHKKMQTDSKQNWSRIVPELMKIRCLVS